MKNIHEMSYEELLRHMDDVLLEIMGKAYQKGYKQGKNDANEYKESDKPLETLQEKRDRIVEQAKRDIEEMKVFRGAVSGRMGYALPNAVCDAEFIINENKRTVVCLLKGQMSGDIYERGIAKCSPDDCFNAHIGKAIALRRALGKEVPNDYIDTPQPTEVRIGDVVKATGLFSPWGNGKVVRLDSPIIPYRGYYVEDGSYNHLENAKIIDDTRV